MKNKNALPVAGFISPLRGSDRQHLYVCYINVNPSGFEENIEKMKRECWVKFI
jgi:hypothetical protein